MIPKMTLELVISQLLQALKDYADGNELELSERIAVIQRNFEELSE